MSIEPYTDEGFSTIFQCSEGALVCSLRAVEGLISVLMTGLFVKGYIAISKNEREVVHKDDKMIYLLSLGQVALQALYYFLFEEFFLLGTIRNLMIWTDILILANMCKIYLVNALDQERASWGIQLLRMINFLMWFYVVVVEGTTLTNSNFKLGYNCLIPDWIILSGYMVLVAMLIVFVGTNIYDKLAWEAAHVQDKKD